MGIRNAAKALIINDNKILVNKNQNSFGDMCYGLPNGAIYYDLSGGGQNQFETLEEAVIRECLEETGYRISVNKLAAIYEEISQNDRFRTEYEQYAHKVHFIFICSITDNSVCPITEKDIDMLESVWINIDELKDIPLYPLVINAKLELILNSENSIYLGSEYV